MRVVYWVSLITLLTDQLLKYLILHVLDLVRGREIDVLPPWLNLRMGWNTGVNFGLFSSNRWVLIAIALIIIAVILWWIKREPGGLWQKISAGLLIGGALGNVADRLIYGAVADFLNMSCCGINNPFVFNTADIAVFAGALGLVVFSNPKKPS
ncbi:Lipoprotein signal peptidase [hydrothermal vent metagenome]|uniref:Lipoprotein signal peptidase n=1 Tax=hydrothermal vent metagenome TaxID=652676 RepID=A0A3B0RTJ7_9ZZZZ